MKLLVAVNVLLLACTAFACIRGIALNWYTPTFPLVAIVLGAGLGLIPFRICAGMNAVLAIAGGFALWFAAGIALVGWQLMVLGQSMHDIESAYETVMILFVIGVIAITSGCVASRRIAKPRTPPT